MWKEGSSIFMSLSFIWRWSLSKLYIIIIIIIIYDREQLVVQAKQATIQNDLMRSTYAEEADRRK